MDESGDLRALHLEYLAEPINTRGEHGFEGKRAYCPGIGETHRVYGYGNILTDIKGPQKECGVNEHRAIESEQSILGGSRDCTHLFATCWPGQTLQET